MNFNQYIQYFLKYKKKAYQIKKLNEFCTWNLLEILKGDPSAIRTNLCKTSWVVDDRKLSIGIECTKYKHTRHAVVCNISVERNFQNEIVSLAIAVKVKFFLVCRFKIKRPSLCFSLKKYFDYLTAVLTIS